MGGGDQRFFSDYFQNPCKLLDLIGRRNRTSYLYKLESEKEEGRGGHGHGEEERY